MTATRLLQKTFIALLALSLIFGCSASHEAGSEAPATAAPSEMADMPESDMMAKREASPTATSSAQVLPRKIIYTGEVTMFCENLDRSATALQQRIFQYKGYIGNADFTGAKGSERTGTWTVRLPAANFDEFLNSLSGVGELQSSSRNSNDVSEEFYDVSARLKSKKMQEERLLQLLKDATGKLSEVLSVEKELARVREEIESVEGRLRYLSNQVDLSTITVTLHEVKNYIPETEPNLLTKMQRALSGSLQAMAQFATGVLLVVVALLPWLIPVFAVIWGVRSWLRGRRKPTVNPDKPTAKGQ